MSFVVKYNCPHCGRRIPHKPEFAGHTVICSACGGKFIEPTDPMPGKDAERLPPPRPDDPPDAYQTRDYSLALMSDTPGGGMATMQEVFEARVLEDAPRAAPAPKDAFAWPPGFAPPGAASPAPKSTSPTPKPPSPLATSQPAHALPPRSVTPAPPQASRPPAASPPPAATPATARPPAATAAKAPIPAAGLAGVTPQQMLDELGRRGLVCVLLIHDFSEANPAQIKHTSHLNRTQAIAMLAEFMLKLEQSGASEEGRAGMMAAMKRLWSGDAPHAG